MENSNLKKASLFRMVMDKHICPYGIKSKYLLKKKGYFVIDNKLENREQVDNFKKKYDVLTTPQTFIDDKRIGGYEDLLKFFGKNKNKTINYTPVIVVFAITLLLALATSYNNYKNPFTIQAGIWFVTYTMSILALLKLQNIEKFSTMFLGYDVLAQKWVPYSYIYPFAEATAGILMSANILNLISIPISFFIGTIGTISVFKAVYIDKRDLKCACVGGDSKVPLGFISLTENLIMILMAIFMFLRS